MGNYCTLLENSIYKEFIHLHLISYQLLHIVHIKSGQTFYNQHLLLTYSHSMTLTCTWRQQLQSSSTTSHQILSPVQPPSNLKQNEFPPLSRDIPQLLIPVPLSKCRPSTMYPTIPKLLPSSKQPSSVLKPSSKVNILKHVLKPPATPPTSKQAPLQNSKPPTSSRDSKDTRACSCPHCDKTYAYRSGLSKHIRKEHGKESKGKGYLSCNLCPSR